MHFDCIKKYARRINIRIFAKTSTLSSSLKKLNKAKNQY